MIKTLKSVIILLSLIISGTAVSVSGDEIDTTTIVKEFSINIQSTAYYDKKMLYNNASSEAGMATTHILDLSYGLAEGTLISVGMPIYADAVNGVTSAGNGDLTIGLRWIPEIQSPVRPVLSLKSTIPTGMIDRGIYQRNNLSSEDSRYLYRTNSVGFDLQCGGTVHLFNLEKPLTFTLLGAARFVGTRNYFGGDFTTQLIANELLSPYINVRGLVSSDKITDFSIADQSELVGELGTNWNVSNSVTINTAVKFSFDTARVEIREYSYPINPRWGFLLGATVQFPRKKRVVVKEVIDSAGIPDNHTNPSDTVLLDSIVPVNLDSDNDGILDDRDSCPDAPELFNGIDDFDGCPDFIQSSNESQESSTLLEGVQFSSGSTALSDVAKRSLQPLIHKMKTGDIGKIEIRGFSDYSGGYYANIKISRKRAESVKEFLLANGIDSSRVTSVGYGSNEPIADNRTPKGRKRNRRIEYVIIENL